MTRRIATVRVANAANTKKRPKPPPRLLTLRPTWITMVQSTSESSARKKGEKRARFRTFIKNRRLLQFNYKGKTEVKQTPTTVRWETSERQQLSQPSNVRTLPPTATQCRAESLLSSSWLSSVLSTPSLPSRPRQLLAECY